MGAAMGKPARARLSFRPHAFPFAHTHRARPLFSFIPLPVFVPYEDLPSEGKVSLLW